VDADAALDGAICMTDQAVSADMLMFAGPHRLVVLRRLIRW
jgi:hypothetical protein